jgi:hypothetical protein
VLDRLDGALREQAGLLLDWGADLPEAPAFRPAEEVDAGVRHLRLLNHHREVALIGARRAELDRAGDRGDWAAEAARVAALAAGIRRLEREGASLHSTNWAAALRAETSAAHHPTA